MSDHQTLVELYRLQRIEAAIRAIHAAICEDSPEECASDTVAQSLRAVAALKEAGLL